MADTTTADQSWKEENCRWKMTIGYGHRCWHQLEDEDENLQEVKKDCLEDC